MRQSISPQSLEAGTFAVKNQKIENKERKLVVWSGADGISSDLTAALGYTGLHSKCMLEYLAGPLLWVMGNDVGLKKIKKS